MFFTFHQNNSGGHYLYSVEKGVNHFIIIEAASIDDACDRLTAITTGFTAYCQCCGERWSQYPIDTDYEPAIFGVPLDSMTSHNAPYSFNNRRKYAAIHYADGVIKTAKLPLSRTDDNTVSERITYV